MSDDADAERQVDIVADVSEWITVREAAQILGVHMSAIPKMIRRGDLQPRYQRPKLRRAEVEALRDARAAPRETALAKGGPHPPDHDHDWLLAPSAAALLGCSVAAVRARAVRGRVPSTLANGRRWFRFDHLQLWLRAKVDQQRRQVSR